MKLESLDAAYDLPQNAELRRKAGLDLKLPGADDATLALGRHTGANRLSVSKKT